MSFRDTKTPAKPTEKAKWQVPMRRSAKGPMEYCLEGELADKFRELFPKHSNLRLMRWFGLSFSTLQRFRREMGLEKDMTAIRRERARDVRKTCEKNGYYDSLRGRRPSEACIEGTRRFREEHGHPMTRLKEMNPRRYRAAVRRRSERRKELHRKEELRWRYGLPRHTKLRMKTMTRRMSARKHRMIKLYNYFGDEDRADVVYWDSETRRSLRMEESAVKAGLTVLEAEG